MRLRSGILFFMLITRAAGAGAQQDTAHTQIQSTDQYSPVQFMVGTKTFNAPFYGQVNTLQHFKLVQPVNMAGLGMNGPFNVSRGGGYVGHIALFYIIPQNITISNQQGKLTGFIYSMSVYGINLVHPGENSGLYLSVGFNAGRMRIIQNEQLRQKNPLFAPMISLNPKIHLGKAVIGLNVQYDYDVSGPNWRRTWFANTDKLNIDKFTQSGLITMLYIGRIITYVRSPSKDL